MRRFSTLILAVGAVSIPSGTSSAASAEDLEACLAANAPKVSSELTVKLVSEHRGGSQTTHEGRIYWRLSDEGRSESLICMSHPPDLRGLAYLILEGEADVNLWGYLPEKNRVSQIHPRGAARRARIARTAIGFDDLRYLPMNTSGAVSQPPRYEKIGKREVAVVDLALPPGEDAVYERIVTFIDKQTCVPLRTEFYETPEKMLKLMTADPASIERRGDRHMARSMLVEDLKNEVRTELRVENMRIDAGLPDKMFSPNRLARNVCSDG